MNKRVTKTKKPTQRWQPTPLVYEIGGIALLMLSALLLIGLLDITKGIAVAQLTDGLKLVLGMGCYLLALMLACIGIGLIWLKDELALLPLLTGCSALLLVFVTAWHLGTPSGSEFSKEQLTVHGGYIGAATSWLLRKAFGNLGATIVLTCLSVVGILVATRKTLTDTLSSVFRWLRTRWRNWQARRRAKAVAKAAHEKSQIKSQEPVKQEPAKEVAQIVSDAPVANQTVTSQQAVTDEEESPFPMETVISAIGKKRSRHRPKEGLPEHYEKIVAALEPPRPEDNPETTTSVEDGIRLVEETLASFKIEAKVVNVKRGPVITRYEVQPAPGVRIKRIENLADDLALALAAIDVRVEAPVPGKSVIGIEVPNRRIALVRLRELLELEEFKFAPSKLTFGVGKDIAGTPKLADLSKMPHLLISGATNSGKSVCLNSLIISLLSRAHPQEVKLSLIDPKRVELTLFKGVPHLLHPVVVDAKGAARALKAIIKEMECRYRLFAELSVRNIDTYNEAVKEDEDAEPLPHIVIVIDELADLMMQAGSEFEKLICRIAQLARATGIHLIIATQRPSVNVITGLIKANIPSRIAFAVASQTDSRVILDINGAERLIGRGDMLFQPLDAPKPIRIQGSFVSEQEVNRVVEVLINEYGEPDEYMFDVYTEEDEDALMLGVRLDKKDPLFDRAVEIIKRKGYASASLLQRELEIGYPRAGKLIDQLEKAGIIGPAEGNKPRKILLPFFVNKPISASEDKEAMA